MHSWPPSPNDFPLGDGRYAFDRDSPESVDQLAEAIRQRAADGLAVYPHGGATSLDWGRPPARPGVLLDTRRLNRVIEYPAADMTITVEAGQTLAQLQSILAQQGQRLNLEAPRPDLATLGGIYATNTCGPRRFGFGRPRDLIIGIGFVSADGQPVKGGGRVVKNVAGYDLPKLLTGSFGTLGVITHLTLTVRPKPEAGAIVLAPYPSTNTLDRVLATLNTSSTRPVSIDLLNRPAANSVGQPSDQPWLLAVGFEGNHASVEAQVHAIPSELDSPDPSVLRDSDAQALWGRLCEAQHPANASWSFKANLSPSAVPAFAASLDPDRWTVHALAGSGIVWGHAIHDPDDPLLIADLKAARARAVAAGGNLIVPTCPTNQKESVGVWGEPRPDWLLAERIKQALDPGGVLNPGRFVGRI